MTLKAPYPWMGAKSRVAADVWRRFDGIVNYVEPFFGSGAVLLGSPGALKCETINDLDGFVANFWRAVTFAPDDVAQYADWPVNECDMNARNIALGSARGEMFEMLMGDPDYFDAKVAGWWAYGQSCWIAHGWASGEGPWHAADGVVVKTKNDGNGAYRARPDLGDAGHGLHRPDVDVREMLGALSRRMRRVRVCCGDWARVLGPSVTTKHGETGVFLDPPYDTEVRKAGIYAEDSGDVSADVRAWAIEHGHDDGLRIALCGYVGEHDMPDDWEVMAWSSKGAYIGKNTEAGTAEKRHLERIWFSPRCVGAAQLGLGL